MRQHQALSHQVYNQALVLNTCLHGLKIPFFIQNYARDGLHASTYLKVSADWLYCTYQRRRQSTMFFFSHHNSCKWKDMEKESGNIYAEIRDWYSRNIGLECSKVLIKLSTIHSVHTQFTEYVLLRKNVSICYCYNQQ